jgi:hypothetical protein
MNQRMDSVRHAVGEHALQPLLREKGVAAALAVLGAAMPLIRQIGILETVATLNTLASDGLAAVHDLHHPPRRPGLSSRGVLPVEMDPAPEIGAARSRGIRGVAVHARGARRRARRPAPHDGATASAPLRPWAGGRDLGPKKSTAVRCFEPL